MKKACYRYRFPSQYESTENHEPFNILYTIRYIEIFNFNKRLRSENQIFLYANEKESISLNILFNKASINILIPTLNI